MATLSGANNHLHSRPWGGENLSCFYGNNTWITGISMHGKKRCANQLFVCCISLKMKKDKFSKTENVHKNNFRRSKAPLLDCFLQGRDLVRGKGDTRRPHLSTCSFALCPRPAATPKTLVRRWGGGRVWWRHLVTV